VRAPVPISGRKSSPFWAEIGATSLPHPAVEGGGVVQPSCFPMFLVVLPWGVLKGL